MHSIKYLFGILILHFIYITITRSDVWKYNKAIQHTLVTVCNKYSTGCSQHNTDFAKTNQNEVVQIRTNFFEDFQICKLIRENKFVILNLQKKIGDSEFIKIIHENEFVKGNRI